MSTRRFTDDLPPEEPEAKTRSAPAAPAAKRAPEPPPSGPRRLSGQPPREAKPPAVPARPAEPPNPLEDTAAGRDVTTTRGGAHLPRTLSQVINEANDRVVRGDLVDYVPMPTGFDPLDGFIGGGLRKTELVLRGGCGRISMRFTCLTSIPKRT
jgi:hypothetical protein